MTYDVEAVRAQFPSLAAGAAHFDGPGGSQVPSRVAEAVRATLSSPISNRGSLNPAERRADEIVHTARQAMAGLLGADAHGIVFGRSMTQLTYDFARTLSKGWVAGDEVVVTRLDHDANIRPWVQAAEAVGATVRWAEFDATTGELTAADVAEVVSDRTRLVAVTAASNLIGTRPDVQEIGRLAHRAGALFYVDGVHFTPHAPVDMDAMGADLFACSPYKFFGPHCGVVAGRPEVLEQLAPDKLLPSSNVVPERFELGTLPYELMAGTTAVVEFIASLLPEATGELRDRVVASMDAIEAHEDALLQRLEGELAGLPEITLYSKAQRRTPTLLLSVDGRTSVELAEHLAELDVNAPADSFYALEASRRLGLGDEGALRVGLAPYTSDSDVDRLLGGITSFIGRRA
ncbi:MAG: cysteine desulfurase-like protein [Nocardioidaceae bacterium]|nr:cysteine desulfurase-like protein [Nocardioidaceae bacterium]